MLVLSMYCFIYPFLINTVSVPKISWQILVSQILPWIRYKGQDLLKDLAFQTFAYSDLNQHKVGSCKRLLWVIPSQHFVQEGLQSALRYCPVRFTHRVGNRKITKMPKRKRQSYTAEFKCEVMKYVETNDNRAASRLYGPGESIIRAWRKNKKCHRRHA